MEHSAGALIDRPFIVKERIGFGREFRGMGNNLTMEGLELDTPAEVLEGSRFVWLEFAVIDGGKTIRALGEITERSQFTVKVKFKHLFPDDKRKLAIVLDTTAYH